jgi:hypothetical protein
MKHAISLLLTIFSLAATAQNFVKYNSSPVNESGASWAGAWGDYDNDGHMDLYVSNYLNKNFLYHNNGNKTFTKITISPIVTSQSIGHWSSTWVDFDDDGDLDMYVVNSYTDNNELFRNNGDGTFTNISSAITDTGATNDNNAAWADTDNDGDLDLFLANGSNSTPATRDEDDSFFINNGDGTFTQNTTSPIATDGGFSQYASFGDYDNDNDADLIVINTFGDNFFYENKGSNVFERVPGLPFLSTGEQPLSAAWGDFNNDNFLDIVIGSYELSRVYYNNGDKTFHEGTFPTLTGNATGVTTGDFNLDGRLDVIFIRTSQTPLLYINNGDETFTKTNAGDLTLTTLDYTNSGAVADYDNDGDLDVYINNDNSGNLLFENTEVTGNWVAFKLVGTNSNSQGIGARVRLKANGVWQTREVAVLSSYRTQNSVLAHFGLGPANFIESLTITWPSGKVQEIGRFARINSNFTIREDVDFYDFSNAPASVISTDNYNTYSNSWVDYDKDGDLDALVGNVSPTNAINLYQNQGNNTFVDKVGTSISGFGGSVYSSTWGDYDNDGDADLFATNNDLTKPNELYKNNGDGTLTKIVVGEILNEITYSGGSSWADYDNDSKLDMFVSNWHYGYPEKTNSLYKGDGLGGFDLVENSVFTVDKQVSSNRMVWSDIDDDGDADLLVQTVSLEKSLLYRNNGDGTFAKDMEWLNSPSNAYAIGAAFGDYDNDGDQDLYLSSGERLFKNDGTGKFTQVTGMAFATEFSEAATWGDYDNDGDLDLYLANGGGPKINSLYRNEGDGTFLKVNSFAAQDESNSRSTAWVDINNDQYLDLFVGNIGINKMFLNTGGIYHGLQINLDGVQSNESGIGAKIKIRTGNQWQMREVFSQQSSLLRVHFGLGTYDKADVVRIEWPSGNIQILKDVAADQVLTITEENTIANEPHTMSTIALEGYEDDVITFDPADFVAAFHDNEGDKLKKVVFPNAPENGTLLYNEEEMTGSPEILVADISKLKFKPDAEFNGETSFEYTVIDNREQGITATITATIEPVNDAPLISAIQNIMTNVMAPNEIIDIPFTVSDIDNDLADLQISVASMDPEIAPPSNFELVPGADGAMLYKFKTVSGGATTVTITVTDGEIQVTSTFNIIINMAHSLDVSFEVEEDHRLQFTTTAFTNHFVDGENDVLKEIRLTSLPKHGTITLNSEPVTSGDVIAAEDIGGLVYLPGANFYGLDDISYDVSDARELTVNVTSGITVTSVDDAPVVASLNSDHLTARPGQTIEVEISFTDIDTPLDEITLSALASNPTVAPASDISFTGTGGIRTFTLNVKEPGTTSVQITVHSPSIVEPLVFSVTVIPNTPLSLNVDFTVGEDATLDFVTNDFTDNTEDAENDDLIKIKITKLPTHGTLTLGSAIVKAGDVLMTNQLSGLTYTPARDFNGEDSFMYDALDEFDLSAASVSKITVRPSNDAPVISPVDDKTVSSATEGDVVTTEVQLTDIDNDAATLTLTATADNGGVLNDPAISVTGTGAARTLTMNVVKSGVTIITMIVSDGLLTSTKTFKLTVISVITGLEDYLAESITVYPNPVSDRMNINVGSNGREIVYELIDTSGKVVKSGSVTNGTLDVQDIASGIYTMKFVIEEKVWVQKIIKK